MADKTIVARAVNDFAKRLFLIPFESGFSFAVELDLFVWKLKYIACSLFIVVESTHHLTLYKLCN